MAPETNDQVSALSEQIARLYEQAEANAAQASERLVGTRGFVGLLGQLAENAAAMAKLSNDAMDLVLRNMRLVGRRDIIRLSRQLARTEDKLERVLQEVEALQDHLRGERQSRYGDGPDAGRSGRRAGRRARTGKPANGPVEREGPG